MGERARCPPASPLAHQDCVAQWVKLLWEEGRLCLGFSQTWLSGMNAQVPMTLAGVMGAGTVLALAACHLASGQPLRSVTTLFLSLESLGELS